MSDVSDLLRPFQHAGVICPLGYGNPVGDAVRMVAPSIASAVYPTANLALFYPFELDEPFTVKQIVWVNGAAVSGSVDVGVYDAVSAVKVVSLGATAQASTGVIQKGNIADTLINPGHYHLGIAVDNITAAFNRVTLDAVLLSALGVKEQGTAFALPGTATLVSTATNYVPLVAALGASVA